MTIWAHDDVMRALAALPDPVGSLVAAFPGSANIPNDQDWLRAWFVQLIESYATGTTPADVTIALSGTGEGSNELAMMQQPPVQADVRLVSIEPRYFRGFRKLESPVNLEESLVVIEGRNSSGKTSLSEAIEWTLTGLLSRRASTQYGHPRELANCITNEFTPDGEETWVELVLSVNGEVRKLRRTLVEDYQKTKDSLPKSVLSLNSKELTPEEAIQALGELFSGVAPILMQHTLRQFVYDQPSARRKYFERLLRIDELTELIRVAVVGDTAVDSFKPETGTPALDAIQALLQSVEDDRSCAALEALSDVESGNAQQVFRETLVLIAGRIFPDLAWPETTYNQYLDLIEGAQARAREAELPILGVLRKPLDKELPDTEQLEVAQKEASRAAIALQSAESAAAALSDAKRAVAQAFDTLASADLIQMESAQDQECPVCLASGRTLRVDRVKTVRSWSPISLALDEARVASRERLKSLRESVREMESSLKGFSTCPPEMAALRSSVDGLAPRLQEAIKAACRAALALDEAVKVFSDELKLVSPHHAFNPQKATDLEPAFEKLRDRMSYLEDLVGASAREDAQYLARERWIAGAHALASITGEIAWRAGRTKAQKHLERIRTDLINLREEVVEGARAAFTEQIGEIWCLLRSDSGASFSQLRIPGARGRGYKLELEVKARISDADSDKEVDALRVFSESQINVVGIAAYVTRSRLLGHRVLIFDDPVQSMDEEHYRTFAGTFLGRLLDDGFQIVLLTHSDEFARRVSHYHSHRPDYMTLRSRSSKRKGCQVDEGSRRVAERLKIARKLGEEGNLERGWLLIRLSIERLYTIVKRRADSGFDPEMWRNSTAEDMWEGGGVGVIVESRVPGAGARLKEILSQAVAGAHDKAATSHTDLNDAIAYLKSLLGPLRVGDG